VAHLIHAKHNFTNTLIALFVSSFITFADIYSIQPLLPVFIKYFNISVALSGLAISITIIAIAISLLIYGPLSDSIGRKNIMSFVLFISVLPMILAGMSNSYHFLLIMRFFQGLLLGGIQSIAMAYIGEEIEKNSLPLAMGLFVSGNSIGGMAGRIISGYIEELLSWHYVFFIFAFLNLIGAVIFMLLLPESKNFHPARFNIKTALSDMAKHLKKPALILGFVLGFCLMFNFVGVFNFVGFKLSSPPYNLGSAQIGWIYLTYLAGTFSSTYSGSLYKKMGIPKTLIFDCIIGIIGISLTYINNLFFFVLGLLFFCFGFFGAHSSACSWVSLHAKEAKGSASSLYLIFFYIGGGLGGVALGLLYSKFYWHGVIAGVIIMFLLISLLSKIMRDFVNKNIIRHF
jgi:YNFM family putative membrane transporter